MTNGISAKMRSRILNLNMPCWRGNSCGARPIQCKSIWFELLPLSSLRKRTPLTMITALQPTKTTSA